MKRFIEASLSILLLCLPLAGQSAQTLTIPHVVDGGGWQSTIVLTNTSATAANGSLVFHKETTGGATEPWTPPFLEVISTSSFVLNGSSSLFLHTTGTAAALSQGWAELNADAGIIGYVVFTIRVPGRQDQEGTAPAVAASNRLLVPYDDSSGYVTGIAIVNPTGSPQDVTVGFRTTTGGVAVSALPPIPAHGHRAFVLSQMFPVIAGRAGLAEFYSATGAVSMIGLRFNPTQSFTAAPVYFQSGPPLITGGTGGGDYTPMDPADPSYPYGIRPTR